MGEMFSDNVKNWYEDQTKGTLIDPEDEEYKLAMTILEQEDTDSDEFTDKTGYYIDSEGNLRQKETTSERLSKAADAVKDLEASQQSEQFAKGQMVQEAQIPASRVGYRPTNVNGVTQRLLRAPNYEKKQQQILNSLLGTRVASRSNPYITSLI